MGVKYDNIVEKDEPPKCQDIFLNQNKEMPLWINYKKR